MRPCNYIEPFFFAGYSKDKENLETAASGGMFYELSKYIIDKGGVVYGVAQPSITEVVHMRADSLQEVQKFRQSKYLKSRMNGCFIQVKKDLDEGKEVLFSGVPCQIAALYRFLKKEYLNLYTVEVVCHGVPYSHVFKEYVEEKSKGEHGRLVDISFRDKCNGWKNYSIREYFEDGYEYVEQGNLHPINRLYLFGINMEERCARCEYAHLPRVADITLADFWKYEGVLLEKNKDRGMSLIAVNNLKGNELFEAMKDDIYCDEVTKEMALASCRHMSNIPLLSKSHRAFVELIKTEQLMLIVDICRLFGDVILADELCTIKEKDIDYVINVLQKDSQEIIYYLNQENVVTGIVTFGAFVQSYIQGEDWINHNFGKVIFSENIVANLKEIFSRNNKILRIPVVDESDRLLFEVRRIRNGNGKKDIRRGIIPFLNLHRKHVVCKFVESNASFAACKKDASVHVYTQSDTYEEEILVRLHEDIRNDIIKEGDIVLTYMKSLPYMDILEQLGVQWIKE